MNPAPKQKPRGEALRQKVLDTALQLFSERGYFNTSLQDIRAAADVSIGAIYHHFQNKEALAKSLYDDLVLRIERAVEEACIGKNDGLSQSRAIIASLFELTEREPQTMQFVLLAQHREYLPEEPPICSSRPFRFMRQVIEESMQAGEIRQLEPWVAATAMFGGALRMMNLRLDKALEQPLSDYLDDVVDCGWRAIAK